MEKLNAFFESLIRHRLFPLVGAAVFALIVVAGLVQQTKPAMAADACAASHNPWPGTVWDPETCYFLKPNADGSVNISVPGGIATAANQVIQITAADAANVALNAINNHVNAIEDNTTTANIALTAINNHVSAIENSTAAIDAGIPAALGAGGGMKVDGSGTALPVSGTVAATQSGTWTVQPGNTANTTPWLVSLQPTTAGGSTTYSANITTAGSGAGVGGVAAYASPGQLYGYALYNNNATVCYIQFFDVAQATVNLGTTAPKMAIGIPANGGANIAFPNGVPFATAITVGVTTTRAGSTACGTGLDINLMYK